MTNLTNSRSYKTKHTKFMLLLNIIMYNYLEYKKETQTWKATFFKKSFHQNESNLILIQSIKKLIGNSWMLIKKTRIFTS